MLDATAVRRWSRLAADALGRTRAEIDALNVFPVPDGDTGTNLHLTVLAAAEAADAAPDAEVWHACAEGALYGARGNSGAILSQALRGLAEILTGGDDLGAALRRAYTLAGEAVAHPVEGTILSVLRAAGETDGPPALAARTAVRRARVALRDTTGQLEVLARNGVVDAGGAGLCVVLDALCAVITDEYPETYEVPARTAELEIVPPDEGYGYEVMYLLEAPDVSTLRTELDELGDSLVVVGGDGLWNVHVHVDDAGAAVEAGVRAGRPYRIRITYLRADAGRHTRHTGRGVVAVTVGEGLSALFQEHGAHVVRRDAGTLTPVRELAEAIALAGDEVVVLPNEQEVLAIAEGAAQHAREEGVRVAVIPAKASAQGLAALAVHDPLRRFDDDVIAMSRAAGAARFGQLEVAGQEAVTSVGICRPGDVLGSVDGDVAVIGTDLADVAVTVLRRLLSGGSELVTLITGAEAPATLAGTVQDRLHTYRPDIEIVAYHGGQDRYPLLIGVE